MTPAERIALAATAVAGLWFLSGLAVIAARTVGYHRRTHQPDTTRSQP